MDGLELYKAFIDGLVSKKDGVYRKWIIEKGYPQTDDNKDINELLGVLSNEQKNVLAKIVCEARNSGIHDTLAYMNELMECDGLEISQNGKCFLMMNMIVCIMTLYVDVKAMIGQSKIIKLKSNASITHINALK